MAQIQNKQETVENYENLQSEYKKLLLEYDSIKTYNPFSLRLADKINELSTKQKEIQELASKIE